MSFVLSTLQSRAHPGLGSHIRSGGGGAGGPSPMDVGALETLAANTEAAAAAVGRGAGKGANPNFITTEEERKETCRKCGKKGHTIRTC